ncbi:MAG TPA: hypothetical protein PL002_07160, partial [Flavobacteriales bacterium]|nr:hypothetical protein [Flavobacteriales bacterium]
PVLRSLLFHILYEDRGPFAHSRSDKRRAAIFSEDEPWGSLLNWINGTTSTAKQCGKCFIQFRKAELDQAFLRVGMTARDRKDQPPSYDILILVVWYRRIPGGNATHRS